MQTPATIARGCEIRHYWFDLSDDQKHRAARRLTGDESPRRFPADYVSSLVRAVCLVLEDERPLTFYQGNFRADNVDYCVSALALLTDSLSYRA